MTSSPLNSAPITPAGVSKESFLERPGRAIREPRKTACAVAAHLGFAAVGVVIAHPEIGAVRRTARARARHPRQRRDADRRRAQSVRASARGSPARLSSRTKSFPAPFIFVKRSMLIWSLTYSRLESQATRTFALHWQRLAPPISFLLISRALFPDRNSFCLRHPANELPAQLAPSPLNDLILQQVKKMPVGGKYSAYAHGHDSFAIRGPFRVRKVFRPARCRFAELLLGRDLSGFHEDDRSVARRKAISSSITKRSIS